MRIRCGTFLAAALVALAVGVAAGWFAAGACENMENTGDSPQKCKRALDLL